MCRGRPTASAAARKSPSAATDGASRRRCATHAAATSAASGGTASAASARCAVCSDIAPETTASAAAAAAPTAIRRSQGPGLTSSTDGSPLLQPPPQVSQRPRTRHVRNLVEVVRRWRRARVPLERVRDPGVVAGAPADACRANHVDQEEEQIEPDEVEPEVDLPKALVEEPPEHLRPPVVEGREERERGAAEEHVVHVRNDEVRVRDLPVERERGDEDPRETTDREDPDRAEREQHRGVEDHVATPGGRDPVEDVDPRR